MSRRSEAPTPRQLEALVELCRPMFWEPPDMPQTVRTLGALLGIRSTNAVNDLLQRLLERELVAKSQTRDGYIPTKAGRNLAGKVILEDEWRAAGGGA